MAEWFSRDSIAVGQTLAMRTAFIFFLLSCFFSSVAGAREAREDKRIEHLLQSVETMKGATFLRNGTEHSSAEAGAHLRMKLRKAGQRVKTAEDFIEGCASRSSLSGESYKIRSADGTVTDAKTFLLARLREYDDATK